MSKHTSAEAYRDIFERVLPEAVALFERKTHDYAPEEGAPPAFMMLGSKGIFADINRKYQKLFKSVWKGKPLTFEQPREVALDMFGHVLMLIYALDKEMEAADDKRGA